MRDFEHCTGKKLILMQDNAPCHAAKRIQEKLCAEGVPTFKWPATSPDLNPIENLWSLWKSCRQAIHGFPINRLELIHQSQLVWATFNSSDAFNFVSSFKN